MDHTIEVCLIQEVEEVYGVKQVTKSVRAEPNPLALPHSQPGDTVTWLLDESAAGKNLRVVFRQVLPLDGSAAQATNGPFSQLSTDAGRIVGTLEGNIRQGRYLYGFFAGDTKVPWANRLEGEDNFGGLDIPKPPPR